MNKRILSILLAVVACFTLFPFPAAAATNVDAAYAGGIVTITGAGFTNGVSYTVRVVDTVVSNIKAMGQVVADGDGNISASITTGILTVLTNYMVYINNPDGTLAGAGVPAEGSGPAYIATILADAGGTITVGASGSYAAGAVITLSASAKSGYEFNKWTSSNGGAFGNANSASTTFAMPAADVTIKANFARISGESPDVTVTTPPAPTPDVKKNGDITTVSATVKATAGTSAGAVTSKIKADVFNAMTEKAKEANAAGQDVLIEIKVESTAEARAVNIEIPGDAFKQMAAGADAAVKIDTGIGSITFNEKAVASIDSTASSGDVTISIEKADKSALPEEVQAKVGDRQVYNISVRVGGMEITDFGGGQVHISIPYTPRAGEEYNSIVVYYIDNTGDLRAVRGKYNPATGMADFTVSHFSQYVVGYNKVIFNDVTANSWYSEGADFLAARGIVDVTGGRFGPADNVLRADFLIMTMKAFGIEPDTMASDNFADAGNTYYTGYLAAAKRHGLVNGIGGNKFAPESAISRQDMFVILYRTLAKLDELPAGTSGKSLGSFNDRGDIADYAKNAIKLLVETGTISGDGGNLTPKSTATRAQAAQVLYKLLSK